MKCFGDRSDDGGQQGKKRTFSSVSQQHSQTGQGREQTPRKGAEDERTTISSGTDTQLGQGEQYTRYRVKKERTEEDENGRNTVESEKKKMDNSLEEGWIDH